MELLFAKNVFGESWMKVPPKTLICPYDTGRWTDLNELKEYVFRSGQNLREAIARQRNTDWGTSVYIGEFGDKTKSEYWGKILHTDDEFSTHIYATVYKYSTF